MLEYSLTPEHPFPCQLIQAVAALRYLLLDKELSVEDMILGGDSAGGHLILSLLIHLISPSPYAPSLDLRGRQLKAIVLVSPWASLSWSQAQQLPSAKGDYLTRKAIEQFYLMAKEPTDDIWALQCEKDKLLSVWKQLYPGPPADSISQKLILAVGDSEILYESCMDFGQGILGLDVVHVCDQQELDLTRQLNYVLAVAPGEAHVQSALDCAVGYDNGNMLRSILAFLGAC
ncbi:Steryl acetyl hydrolase [Penicillium ucsense]|uniref:Steryl acetyl hydrolase n=1 Tax=Penicillium ucsense TaxID=2839758 RepID=A0A8J8VY32_9EURO|nr:Steryl acetyl hydrolase [Penicillium ucsense]KAF7734395.1 Steryl acetyl hydrolase [Penicillium ucsense]